eukprot:7244638-Ditylum_brightwellii.AAC.1
MAVQIKSQQCSQGLDFHQGAIVEDVQALVQDTTCIREMFVGFGTDRRIDIIRWSIGLHICQMQGGTILSGFGPI